ncbi:non-ribosomal peptide synthase/polyketide synthase [Rhodococcus sp. 3A]|uniref:non-ribosomal peptide synthase/polyketide synthase n=1 Tax=Rhodococcus sp. 3A TaxID=2834581 RepID=UPI0028A08F49|nr:non-ribosomal peptide synthase/polyketide synthase [Rhodococcus sp. 3A]
MLGSGRVGAHDNFFDLGGNSLSVTRVAARLGEFSGTGISVRDVFTAPTVAELALRLAEPTAAGGARPVLSAVQRPARIPLSPAQQRMWFINQFDPASPAYNLPLAVRMSGALDVAALSQALDDVVGRHESLRTVFPDTDGGPAQVVVSAADLSMPLEVVEVPEGELDSRMIAFASRGFDLSEDLPVRATLFRTGSGEHVLAITLHHIAADGWSFGPLGGDVMTAYAARAESRSPEWIPLEVQYADYSLWHRAVLGSEDEPESLARRQLEYWTRTLDGLPDELKLPFDRPRRTEQSYAGGSVGFTIDPEIHSGIERLAREHGATVFMVAHAAFALLLARLSASDDIAVGAPIAGRGERALDNLVGMFVNTLVLRTRVESAETFAELLTRVRDGDIGAFGHADLPFERLVDVLEPTRTSAHHPVIQTALSMQPTALDDIELPGLRVRVEAVDARVAKFDLQLTLGETIDPAGVPSGIRAEFTYAADLFDDVTVRRYAAQLVRILETVIADPTTVVGDVNLLDDAERARLAPVRGAPCRPARLLPEVLAESAADPSATALVFGGRSMTYGELDRRSNLWARELIEAGAGPETFVAVALARSIESVLAVWAVAKTGAAFVPVDPSYPAERIAHMLGDSGAALGLTTIEFRGGLPDSARWLVMDDPDHTALVESHSSAAVTAADRLGRMHADQLAYLIYTSGSTGLPKGVAVTHSGLANLLTELADEYELTADARTLHFASPSFDASVFEYLMAFCAGATMVIVPHSVYGGTELAELLGEQGVTHAFITPAALASVDPTGLDELAVIVVGGEAWGADLAERWVPGRALFNGYGPTESSMMVTQSGPLMLGERMTIGRPVRGVEAFVLDARLHPVPPGVPGELYVSGPALARGYHQRLGLTAERFVANPHGAPGRRMYRTGDLVRWVESRTGTYVIEYVGRSDFQVKIRGFRVELGEIDSAFRAHSAVGFAATVAHVTESGVAALVTYVCAASGNEVDVDDLTAFVGGALPAHMVPGSIMVLDSIPLTPAGKLDRRALPEPVFASQTRFTAPDTADELAVAAAFADVLGESRIGVDDNFFALGGNSLSATQVVSRVGSAFGTRVSVRTLFDNPTVRQLVSAVATSGPDASSGRPALTRRERPGRIPLSLAQQRIWFLNQFDPSSSAYNIPLALRMSGRIDVPALRAALGDVLERHETLRTVYPGSADGAHQEILPSAAAEFDLTPIRTAPDQLMLRIAEYAAAGFDVTREIPFRIHLFRENRSEHVLLLVAHHIAADGWSFGPLAADVMAAYASRVEGLAPSWEPLPVQYADYSVWQRELLGAEDDPDSLSAKQIERWRAALDGAPEAIDLPTDHPRPAVASHRGERVEFVIDADTHRGLVERAQKGGTTLFMVVHAAFATLLHRLSGSTDIVIGTPVAGRGDEGLDPLVGMFVNTLALRTRIHPGESVDALLEQVRDVDLTAFQDTEVPFDRLVEILRPTRSSDRHPLFQVMFAFQNLRPVTLELPQLVVEAVDFDPHIAKFDLDLALAEIVDDAGHHHGISGAFTFASELFERATVAGFADRFLRILEAVASADDIAVGDIAILGAAEQQSLAPVWGGPLLADATLPELLVGTAERYPDSTALVFDGVSIDYRELDRRSTQLARALVGMGVGPETYVAVALPRSVESVLCVWAAAKTGAAYVPIDPAHPVDRIAHILRDSGVVVGVTRAEFAERLPGVTDWLVLDDPEVLRELSSASTEPMEDADRTSALHVDHPAYLIYTSGSTGLPKGVVVSHRGLANLAGSYTAAVRTTEKSRVAHLASPTFDLSVLELLLAHTAGAALVVCPPGVYGGVELHEVLQSERVTHMTITNAALASVDPEGLDDLRSIVVGGDACPPETVARWADRIELVNGYGPTEVTVGATFSSVLGPGRDITIGGPLPGVAAVVLDSRLRPVPVGVVGELYLLGPALARGYHERAALTAHRFVASPFEAAGARMYRTGDIVRWRAVHSGVTGSMTDGTLPGHAIEYLGRSDHQIKVRGLRIELGEIDAALNAHPDVEFAATLGYESPSETRLASHVLVGAGADRDPAALLAFLRQALPGYMVPSALVFLDTIPLTPNGKLDRGALSAPDFGAAAKEIAYRAPRNALERSIADAFAEVLGGTDIGLDTDFFDAGGNSLSATRVTARVGALLGIRVTVRDVFEAPTVLALADSLAPRMSEAGDGASAGPDLVPQPRPDRIPLSLAQQRMWFLNQFDTSSATYNLPAAVRLTGSLDRAALTSAIDDLITRHESLRTVFPDSRGGPHQVILEPGEFSPDTARVRVNEAALHADLREFLLAGFDVSQAVPLRVKVYSLGDTEHVLALVVHHISADGASMEPLIRDLMIAYAGRAAGRAPTWAPLPVQYADYALWQRQVLGDESDPGSLAAAQLQYWTRALAGVPDQLSLPGDRVRPAVPSHQGAATRFSLDAGTHRALTELARAHGASLFMVAHAALAVLLGRLGTTADITVGTAVGGRGRVELDDIIGMFVNTLVLRTTVDPGRPFAALLEQARDVDLEAFAHADLPFERLVEVLSPVRSTSHHPLFQVALGVEAVTADRLELDGLSVEPLDVPASIAKFDLHFTLTERLGGAGEAAGIDAELVYATDIFDEDTAAEYAIRLHRIFEAVVADPHRPVGDIPVLSDEEYAALTPVRGADARPVQLLPEILADAVAAAPEGPAVVFEGEVLSYRDLDEQSNQLARLLVDRGVGPETRVALALPRSFESVVAVWAVAKSGAAFVPVDPGYPADRILHMVQDSGAMVGLTVSAQRELLPDSVRWMLLDDPALEVRCTHESRLPFTDRDRMRPILSDQVAYVIYTSGSTGRPKGVAVTHRGLTNLVTDERELLGVTSGSRTLHFASPSFDASVFEMLMALGAGATMVIAPPTIYGGSELAELLAAERVTHAFSTPAALASVDHHGLDDLAVVVVAGDVCPPELVARWAPGRRMVNAYGPSEATIMSSITEPLRAGEPVTIGGPSRGVRALVLDQRLRPVPVGVPGELYVGGPSLARGYLGRPGLTAERFVADPYGEPGDLLYRTGDLVRWRENRVLDFVGRTDHQVKIRGFRIELGEIDAALTAHPQIEYATTIGYEHPNGETSLVAYVLPFTGENVDRVEVANFVGRTLPAYMVPTSVTLLDVLPLTPAGKLDRTALPDPVFAAAARVFEAPRNPMELIVAGIFSDILALPEIGIHDSFFDLGGNSLLATQVVSRINAAVDVHVGVRQVFESPTVAALAARVTETTTHGVHRPALSARPRPDHIPLSPAQQRMWFINQFDTASPAYNLPVALRLSGAVDVRAMQIAIADLVGRHEALRTVYPDSADGPHQVIVPAGDAVPDLAPVPAHPDDILERVTALVTTGFDVTADVPLRAWMYRVGAEDYVLVMVAHHISGDGWSLAPLARDVMLAYTARAEGHVPRWTPLPVQYADYALWQRDLLGDEADPDSVATAQIAYWTRTLDGLPDRLALPADRPRPAVASHRGGHVPFTVDADTHRALLALARSRNASLFMVMHTALAVLLARLSNESDIAVGAPIAGRGEESLDELVGMFVNTLVLRTHVDLASSFVDGLTVARSTDLNAFAHSDIPFERLVDVLNPVRSRAHHPLFQVAFSFQNLAATTLALPGLHVEGLDVPNSISNFDLHLTLSEKHDVDGTPDVIEAQFTYATDLFDESTVRTFAERFVRILESIVRNPDVAVGAIDLLDDSERHAVLHGFNDTAVDLPPTTLAELFSAQAARTPDAVAVSFDGLELTYTEFDRRVDALAHRLIDLGVGPESVVGLAMNRSIELLVGMYAVLRAGGAYLPIDLAHPAERLAYVLDAARPVCVLTTSADGFAAEDVRVIDIDTLDLTGRPHGPVTDAHRLASLRPENTAYLIFTSGSTGRPKGVAVSHAAVANQLRWKQHEYPLDTTDTVVQKTPATFDLSVWELFWPLTAGARLVIARPDGHRDPAYLADLMREQRVTTAHFVPSLLDAFLATPGAGEQPALRRVLCIGEALPADTAARFGRLFGGVALHNLYGPTEAAVSVTAWTHTGTETDSIPIGSPEWNTQVFVLDARLNPVPVGVAGELYLAGDQLARGYVGRTDLTAERFVAHPFGPPGARLYRTGDVVRWSVRDGKGALDYLGRSDFQVKVRGFRIELGEIESALVASRGVGQAVVVAHQDPHTGTALIGYVVPDDGAAVDPAAVLAEVGGTVPSYMVPAALVVLEALPLTANGKLDRKALPAPDFVSATGEYRDPATATEEAVAGVFADVLGVEQVGADANFFDLGGNSLVATRVVARLSEQLGRRVEIRSLFEAPAVFALAALLDSRDATAAARPALAPAVRPDHIPLSSAQHRMWFLNRFDPDSAVHNIPVAVRLSGDLDVDALECALTDVVGRHESLRTVYPDSSDGPHQVILPVGRGGADLSVVPTDEATLPALIAGLVTAGFDVTTDVPVRARIYRLSATEHVLVLVVHHISGDGWSMAPMVRDVMTAYAARAAGTAPGWAPLPVQYADYALWQRELLGDETDPESMAARQLGFWTRTLTGMPGQLDLPADRPRPAVASYRGGTVDFTVPTDLHGRLLGAARDANASLFMVVHSALAVLLSRLAGTGDIAVGTPVAGRGERALDDLIGMFVNTLVLRQQVDGGRSFAELLADVRETDLAAFSHADVPFERLVEVINPERSTGRHPLFQVMLAFQNLDQTTLELGDLSVSGVDFDVDIAKFDLQLTLMEQFDSDGRPDGIAARLTYASDLYDEPSMHVFGQRFLQVLRAATDGPDTAVGDIDVLGSGERKQIAGTNATLHDVLSGTLASLFDMRVGADPDRIAVVFDTDELTYTEFDDRVNRLARRLIEQGVGPESVVAVAMRRSVDLLVAIYAVVKAGGAYLPVDPDHPVDRTAYVLDTARPVCVLVSGNTRPGAGTLPVIDVASEDLSGYDGTPVTDMDRLWPLTAANTAYVLFTSGSTGRPKGVAVSHGAIVNRLLWMQHEYALTSEDVVLQKTPVTFDVSVWELFWPLQVGATLVVAAPDGHRDPRYLAGLVQERHVTTMHFVPSMLSVFVSEPAVAVCDSLRLVFCSGEVLTPEQVSRFRAVSGAGLHNLYGPTEAAVDVTYWETGPADTHTVPIGRPVWNTQLHVLDGRLHPVPVGVAGELYLAGEQLARGYLGRADLSADRFVANPFAAGGRMYRTGDLVRRRGDGALEYVGRTDFQVKLRGQRIELGEIEAALEAHAGVSQAVVVVHRDERGEEALVAYLVGRRPADWSDVRAHLSARVPSYMIPAHVVHLDALPLSVNGKLDRTALPAPVRSAAADYQAPRTAAERAVVTVFENVLGVVGVGVDDSFFDLGGNSLIATRVASALGAELGTDFPLQWMFADPTPRSLGQRIQQGAPDGARDANGSLDVLLPIRTRGTAEPLFCVHPFIGLAWSYAGLSRELTQDRPVYGLQSPALTEDGPSLETIADFAARYVREIRSIQPHGPYHLLGWSLGGVIAHEMAVQLQGAGEEVRLLGLLDSYVGLDRNVENTATTADLLGGAGLDLPDPGVLDELAPGGRFDAERAAALLRVVGGPLAALTAPQLDRIYGNALRAPDLIDAHRPREFDGDLVFFTAALDDGFHVDPVTCWGRFVRGTVVEYPVDATHWTMTTPDALAVIAPHLETAGRRPRHAAPDADPDDSENRPHSVR